MQGSSPFSSTLPLSRSPHVRWAGDDDHLVLLDLASGEYFMLNGAGREVWRLLGDGSDTEAIVATLAEASPAPRDQVETEVGELLQYLDSEGLVRPGEAPPDACPAEPPPATGAPRISRDDLTNGRPPSPFAVATAWAVLAWFDVVASRRGLHGLLAAMPECPEASADSEAEEARQVMARLDRASRFHLRKAWCLPRSAAATWLMRRRGIPARLVLGVRPMPFFAHAWVEVDGHAVGEEEQVCSLHVLDRF